MCSSHSFAHWLPSVQSGSRGEKHSRFFQLRGISLHSGTPARANSEFPIKCLSFLRRKESGNKKRRANQSDWVFAARRCVSRACSWEGRGQGTDGETVLTSKSLKSVFFPAHLSTRSCFRSIGFCNVYTYIYNYIEQSSSGLQEVFSVFRLLVTVRTWRSFFAGPLWMPRSPRNTGHRSAGTKGDQGGFGLKFWAAKRTG